MAALVVDDDGTVLEANPLAVQVFGYSTEKFCRRSIEDLVPIDFRERHVHHRGHYTGAPSVRRMGMGRELPARRANGTTFPAEIGLIPFHRYGQPCVVVLVADVTLRRQRETTLLAEAWAGRPVGPREVVPIGLKPRRIPGVAVGG